jgi:hypothetical protein
MEKIKIFMSDNQNIDSIETDINNWIAKNEPIITRVIQSSDCAMSESEYSNSSNFRFFITIFYQDHLESPTKQ